MYALFYMIYVYEYLVLGSVPDKGNATEQNEH